MAAEARDRPHGNANFLVEFGAGKGIGFAEVIFPTFAVADRAAEPRAAVAASGGPDSIASPHLVLRRGATGALDLYEWWQQARSGQAPRRRVLKVKLLAEDRATVVLTWRFRNVRPVSLSYSPLRALEGGILMETLELAFDGIEMS